MEKINSILSAILEKIKPSREEERNINKLIKNYKDLINKELKKKKIKAEVFLGGSFAKGTVIKKDKYDIDLFVRFDKIYSDDKLSNLLEGVIKNLKNKSSVHGSRDYFRLKIGNNLFLEIVPVRKIDKLSDSKNITDLSYFHVKYINKKIKSQKILDEIRIAKAFCYANNCYGAESYIKGFSGYSIELLVYYYGGFLKFAKAIANFKEDKLIIDLEKYYKNKRDVLIDLNSSKLNSKIIIIDPTFKKRNVAAALSIDTFNKFQNVCRLFLKKPSLKYFESNKIDFEAIKKNAQSRKQDFVLFEIETDKQAGDIAGSKLLKFYDHLFRELTSYFKISNKFFEYDDVSKSKCFFAGKNKEKIIFDGPKLVDKKNVERFKKRHKNTFVKGGKIYSQEKINFNLLQFLRDWTKKNGVKIKDMHITDLKIVD